jgi:hypothetical protein
MQMQHQQLQRECALKPGPSDKEALENAYLMGVDAIAAGASVDDCPFGFEPLAAEWRRGFNAEPASVVEEDFKFTME